MLTSPNKKIRLTLASAIFWAGLSTSSIAQVLSGAEIKATHAGKCLEYWGASEGVECFRNNGVATFDDKQYGKDRGAWEIHGDKMCVKYRKAEETVCSSYKRLSDGTYTNQDGSYTWRIRN